MSIRKNAIVAVFLALALVLIGGCAPAPTPVPLPPTSQPPAPTVAPTAAPRPTAAPTTAPMAPPTVAPTAVPKPTDTATPVPKKITFVIGSAPNLVNAFIYPAKELYAKEEGLDISIVAANGSLDALKFAAAGTADFASSNVITNAQARAEGLPAVDVFDAYQKYDFGIIALDSSGIKSIADLKGKKIGFVSLSSGTYPNLYAMLSVAKLGKDDITPVTVGQNGPAVLQQGTIDALSSWETQWAPMQAGGAKLTIIRGDSMVNWDGGGIFASPTKIRQDPDVVRRFVRALYKGFVYSRQNPDKSLDIVAKALPEVTQNREASLASWKGVIEGAFVGPAQWHGLGWIDVTRRQSQADFLASLGIINSRPDMAPTVDNQFVEQVQKELKDWKP